MEELRRQRDIAQSQVDELRKKLEEDLKVLSCSPSHELLLSLSLIIASLVHKFRYQAIWNCYNHQRKSVCLTLKHCLVKLMVKSLAGVIKQGGQ